MIIGEKRIIKIFILMLTFKLGYSQTLVDSLSINPNPFASSTTIYFGNVSSDTVSLAVYDKWGHIVKTFIKDSIITKGNHSVNFFADTLQDQIFVVYMNFGSSKSFHKLAYKSSTAGVKQISTLKNSIKFNPNPTDNLLTIPINGLKNIIVTDIEGKTCKTIQTQENTISLSELSSGSYLVSVFSPENKLLSTEKIIKMD